MREIPGFMFDQKELRDVMAAATAAGAIDALMDLHKEGRLCVGDIVAVSKLLHEDDNPKVKQLAERFDLIRCVMGSLSNEPRDPPPASPN